METISQNILNCWVVEYSPIQDCFHICTIDDMLSKNIEIIFNPNVEEYPGYIPICICKNYEKALEFKNRIEDKLNNLDNMEA